jgi:hypothetical protein
LRFRIDHFNHGIAGTIMFLSFLLVMDNFVWAQFLYFFLTFAIFGLMLNVFLPMIKINKIIKTMFELRFFYFLFTLLFSIYTQEWIVFISMAIFQTSYDLTVYFSKKSKVYRVD